jgi:hypothetical protein
MAVQTTIQKVGHCPMDAGAAFDWVSLPLLTANQAVRNVWHTLLDIIEVFNSSPDSFFALYRLIAYNPMSLSDLLTPAISKPITLLNQIVLSGPSNSRVILAS